MGTFLKPQAGSGATTLPARWYISDEIFDEERERIFADRWICAGRAETLAAPGDYFLATIAGESLIVTKDRDERVHAFYNVCRHRGTRMCERENGHFSGSIQCPYHAWTYGLDGRLMAARNMNEIETFDRDDYPLHEAALAIFEGFIFVNLASDPEPFETAFAPLIGRFSDWNIGGLRTAASIDYRLACNWKLVFLNYSECYHCPLVHPQLDKLSPSDSGRNDLSEGPFLGGYSELRNPNGSLTTSGARTRPPLGAVHGEDCSRDYYYTIFPSLLLSLHADYVMVHYMHPVSAGETNVTCAWLFDPKTMEGDGFDPSDAVDFWDLTNRQDWHVNELTQLGLHSRAYRPGPYANAEGLLRAFDRYYLSVMDEAR